MNIRRVLMALAVAGALLVTGAAPAFADGPPVPPGCSFDQGVLTCVTTTTTTPTAGPFTTGVVPASSTFGGVTGVQICQFEGVTRSVLHIELLDVSLGETVTTTTTTERHGLHGKVFDTSTSTSVSLDSVQIADMLSCIFI